MTKLQVLSFIKVVFFVMFGFLVGKKAAVTFNMFVHT